MTRSPISILAVLTLVSVASLSAQSYDEIANLKTGDYIDQSSVIARLWVVDEVTVGDRVLTPTAKWFDFRPNGKQYSGNGWLQNFQGTWTYDPAAKQMLSYNESGEADEYGPFNLNFKGDQMIWQRNEDGMAVKVTLSPADEKPKAPWDKLKGRWTLDGSETWNKTTNIVDIADVEGFSLFFLWDHGYVKYDAGQKQVDRGIWQMGAHSTTVIMVSIQGDAQHTYTLSFEDDRMILSSEEGEITEKLIFSR